jgi:hypothetical protein
MEPTKGAPLVVFIFFRNLREMRDDKISLG